jgi:predicted ribosome quality control (RQC) complex YloA/Tae2 family protein
MNQEQKQKLIEHLKAAIEAFEKGISLFENKDFSNFPQGKEDEIMAYCKKCSENMNAARELDTFYTEVYQQFSDGGNESDCRIAKNHWCFAKQEFVRARLKDLTGNN